ncbi:MAG: hypothetical protein FGM41_05995 [Bacteroidetes bacterium]|jgi:nucleotidyltransferase substrate binding protein (TIGR01987 family)|nr:hypothetical protein [Bacteroidota bacterium]
MELAQKYTALCHSLVLALNDFELAMNADFAKYNSLEIDWIKNAQIQKFEFCIELLWKTAKVYLESIEEKIYTPKLTIKTLFILQIIDEQNYLGLMNCLADRNQLSHIYKSEMFDLIQTEMPKHLENIKIASNILNSLKIN